MNNSDYISSRTAVLTPERILYANSLEELKQKALVLKRKSDLRTALFTGECYQSESVRRKEVGCPRIYAQNTNDMRVMNAFPCYGISYIPDCPKFHTGECWMHFDELGFRMK